MTALGRGTRVYCITNTVGFHAQLSGKKKKGIKISIWATTQLPLP